MRNYKKAVALALGILGTSSAWAANEDACKLEAPQPDLIHNISRWTSYFAKVSADGRYMYYISSGNYIMDLEAPGETQVKVPGPYDPVPAPPTGPEHKVQHFSVPRPGMVVYDNEQFISKMKQGETVDLTDESSTARVGDMGSYQSMGVIKDPPGGKPTYRVIAGSLMISEINMETKEEKNRENHACGEQGRYQLPMISKDGKYISVYDTEDGVTKILEYKKGSNCKEVLNLGYATGKVEFAYDGSAITFHTDSFNKEDVGNQFKSPQMDMVKNVFVLDIEKDGDKLKAGTLRKITDNVKPGENSYYPSFTTDGKVAFIHVDPKGRSDGRPQYSFRRVPYKNVNTSIASPLHDNNKCQEATASTFALGALMQRVCSELFQGSAAGGTEAALWALSLNPDACQKLVEKNWAQYESQIKNDDTLLQSARFDQSHLNNVTKKAVAAVCPKKNPNYHPPHPVIFDTNGDTHVTVETNPAVAFQQLCFSCHDGVQGTTKYEWDKLNLNDVNRMLIAIQEGAMPRGTTQNREAAMAPIIEALLQRQRDLEERAANEE